MAGYTLEDFPVYDFYNEYGAATGIQTFDKPSEVNTIYNYYKTHYPNWQPRGDINEQKVLNAAAPVSKDASALGSNATLVPGTPAADNQVNVADYSGQLATNPSLLLNGDKVLSNRVPMVDANTAGTTIDGNDTKYQMNSGALSTTATTAENQNAVSNTASKIDPKQAATYTAALTADQVAAQDMQGAKGTVSDKSQVTAQQIDENATASGQNALGKALSSYASQNTLNVIDTSSSAGKALAQALGEGNYTDSKSTLKGQLDILAKEFVGPDGEAKIPSWAAGTARNVSKIAAFSGMSGTAATAAMASAIMEASIPIAQQDSQLFASIDAQNLNNRQAATINRANVLANISLANLDARTTAAVENAKNFMQMDLANLNNEQQASVINTQNRVQSILEDAKSKNAERLFTAQSQNEMNQFYDNLNSSIDTFNTSQLNSMNQFNASEANKTSQFNASQINTIAQFNSQLENNRQQFYTNMQYQIDTANAAWRQNVTLTNNKNTFDAAAVDVQNSVNLSVEQLNQLWDRSDALLDYIFKNSQNEADRATTLMLQKLNAHASYRTAELQVSASKRSSGGFGSILGGLVGKFAGAIGGPIGSSIGGALGSKVGSLFS